MKITQSQLHDIIREELKQSLSNEGILDRLKGVFGGKEEEPEPEVEPEPEPELEPEPEPEPWTRAGRHRAAVERARQEEEGKRAARRARRIWSDKREYDQRRRWAMEDGKDPDKVGVPRPHKSIEAFRAAWRKHNGYGALNFDNLLDPKPHRGQPDYTYTSPDIEATLRRSPFMEGTKMKLTQSQFIRIIREELKSVLDEKKKKDCFSHEKYKTFDGKSSCIQKQKGLSKERANAYVASVLRDMGELDERKKKRKKRKKKKKKGDRCTRIAKRKYDVWPSAYASGAVVKCRQGKIWKGVKEAEGDGEDLERKIRRALRDEGGAAGMDALVKHTDASEADIKGAIGEMDDVGRHEDGDYILDDGDTVDILDEDLRKWFGRKGEKGSKGGWVDCNAPDGKGGYKECAQGDRKKKPACRPTPSACKQPGKGKKWGKKSAKESLNMNIDQIIFEETQEFVFREVIQPHLTEAFLEDGTPVCVGCLSEQLFEATCDCPHLVYEAEYRGRKVKLNKPTRGDVKKFKVYVKDPKTGNVKKVNFGHGGSSAKAKGEKTMKIRKSNPKARKSFRARHNCDNPGPKTKARYWSCKKW